MLLNLFFSFLIVVSFSIANASGSYGALSFYKRSLSNRVPAINSRHFSSSQLLLHKDYHNNFFSEQYHIAKKYKYEKLTQDEKNRFLDSELNYLTLKKILLKPLSKLSSTNDIPSKVNEISTKYFVGFSKMYQNFIYGGYHHTVFELMGYINYLHNNKTRFNVKSFSLLDLLPKDDMLQDFNDGTEKLKRYRIDYATGKSLVSNVEYLLLKKKLSILTSRLNNDDLDIVASENHLLSDEDGFIDVFSDHEVFSFLSELSNSLGNMERTFLLIPTANGVRLKVHYEKGLFERAAINLLNGEEMDVTDIVRELRSVPLFLPEKENITIEGCFTLYWKGLASLNVERRNKGKQVWPDTHSAIMNSILYSSEPNKILDMKLKCLFHRVHISGKKFSSLFSELKYLKKREFTILGPEFIKSSTEENLIHTIASLSKTDFPFERSSISIRNEDLGESRISEIKGLHYRTIHDLKKTVTEKVEFKVLENGVVIIIVHVQPVMINGHTFNFFTINNETQLSKMDLRLGDDIFVYADENMAPKVLFSCKNGSKKPIQFPKICSKCQAPLKKVSRFGEDVLMCTSHLSCVNESATKIRNFTSAHGLYVPSLTTSVINGLIDTALISDAADLFSLAEKDYGITQFIEKNEYLLMLKEIEESKNCTLLQFINALSIPSIDINICQELIYKFGSLSSLRCLNIKKLSGFDINVARSIVNYFASEENQIMIDRLVEYGVNISEPTKEIFDLFSRSADQYNNEEYKNIVCKIIYNDEQHNISDFEYDLLDKKAREIEILNPDWILPRKNTFTKNQVVWVDPIVNLNKTYEIDDVSVFFENHEKDGCMVEPKINGMGCSLVYKKGILVEAYTKRNKLSSFNILAMLKTITHIPRQLTTNINGVIRGEIYVSDDEFRDFQAKQNDRNSTIFVEPLTAVVSFFRGYSSAEYLRNYINFFPFYLQIDEQYEDKPVIDSRQNLHAYFSNLGFKPLVRKTFPLFFTNKALIKYITDPEKRRRDFNVAIDGMVIKPNKLSLNTLENTKESIGYKFKLETLRSNVTEVKYIKQKNGFLSAVLSINPLQFSNGKKVTHISVEKISNLENIGINSTVSVGYIGGVVPKMEKIEEPENNQNVVHVGIPKKCPECNKNLNKNDEGRLKCDNTFCVGVTSISAIHHFAKVMKISTFDKITTLIDSGIIYDISAFYRILPEHLYSYLDSTEISDFFSDIERSKEINLETFLYALSINKVGERTARKLANRLPEVDEWFSIDENILRRKGIDSNIAISFVRYMKNNKQLIANLVDNIFRNSTEKTFKNNGHALVSNESDLEKVSLDSLLTQFINKNKTFEGILQQTTQALRISLIDSENLIELLKYLRIDAADIEKKKFLERDIKSSVKTKKRCLDTLSSIFPKS